MKVDIRGLFATRGAKIIERLDAVLTVQQAVVFLIAVYATFAKWGPSGVAAFVVVFVMITTFLSWQSLRQVRDALRIVPTWGEGLFAGVRWGWRPDKPADVLGPYCPNLGHSTCLRRSGTDRDAANDDIMGAGVTLMCPSDPTERFDFSSLSARLLSVGEVRARVQAALQAAGLWKSGRR